MTRRPRPPGEQPSLQPWVYVCLGLIATLLVVQFALPPHPPRTVACQLGVHRC